MTKLRRPTLRDLAKTVGVSASTASRALNNNTAISEEIRKRVFKAAKDANYIPNSLARGLALKRSQLIGLLVPSIANPFFAEILRGGSADWLLDGCCCRFATFVAPPVARQLLGGRFDQVLLRPDLLPYYDKESLTIVSEVGGRDILGPGPAARSGPDHLPLVVRLSIEMERSHG